MKTAFVDGVLLDGHGGPSRSGATLVVDGPRIVEVGSTRHFGPDVHVVDLAGRRILPGLIDCHVHLAPWGLALSHHQDKRLMLLAAETVRALETTLAGGCTTARDLGGLDAGFRDAVARGLLAGPRLLCSLVIVSPTNGIADATTAQGAPSPRVPGMPDPECNGPYGARAKVREVLRAGADVIKIAVSGGVSSPKLVPRRPIFTKAEIEAIVDEAHMAGVPVVCHALGGPNLLAAVEAGVDTIEHGAWLDEACVTEMARRGTWYVPTLAIYRWHATRGDAAKQARTRALGEAHRRSLDLALAAGVRIAMGTDMGAYGYGDTALELELLIEAGMTPGEAIRTGTGRAAECLGLAEEVGTLEAGRAADLLVVDGDPLADITVLRRADRRALVMKGGIPMAGTGRAAWFGATEAVGAQWRA